ncbi:MAG: ATP-binding cassette domain-containing protein [Rhodothermaceae bacterium]
MYIVEAVNLTKVYSSAFGRKKVVALSDFNLAVKPGTIFGLLGPNGAGKTTFIKILLGIGQLTSGDAKIFNQPLSNYVVKKKVGYLPENHKYPLYLTGEQVLRFFAELSGYESENLDQRINYLLDIVNMEKWRNTKIKAYSKGMMQRIGLAQALVNDPELIFLDEPTDGVDPIGRKEIRTVLENLKSEGKTIFLNSHLLSEVEMVTDRVAILNKGKLLKEGTVEELTTQKEQVKITIDNSIEALKGNGFFEDFKIIEKNDNHFTASINDNLELNKIIDSLRQKGIVITSVVPNKSSLEDYFISVINNSENKE